MIQMLCPACLESGERHHAFMACWQRDIAPDSARVVGWQQAGHVFDLLTWSATLQHRHVVADRPDCVFEATIQKGEITIQPSNASAIPDPSTDQTTKP
jgi:hypothetical protein